MVYSAAKDNPTLDLEWARQCEVGLPRPDLVVFLDLEPEVAEKRGGFGEEKYEKKIFQERVRSQFLQLQHTRHEGSDMKVINAGVSVQEVAEKILPEAELILRCTENGIIKELRVVQDWRVKPEEWLTSPDGPAASEE